MAKPIGQVSGYYISSVSFDKNTNQYFGRTVLANGGVSGNGNGMVFGKAGDKSRGDALAALYNQQSAVQGPPQPTQGPPAPAEVQGPPLPTGLLSSKTTDAGSSDANYKQPNTIMPLPGTNNNQASYDTDNEEFLGNLGPKTTSTPHDDIIASANNIRGQSGVTGGSNDSGLFGMALQGIFDNEVNKQNAAAAAKAANAPRMAATTGLDVKGTNEVFNTIRKPRRGLLSNKSAGNTLSNPLVQKLTLLGS